MECESCPDCNSLNTQILNFFYHEPDDVDQRKGYQAECLDCECCFDVYQNTGRESIMISTSLDLSAYTISKLGSLYQDQILSFTEFSQELRLRGYSNKEVKLLLDTYDPYTPNFSDMVEHELYL